MTQTPNKASYSDQRRCAETPATFVNKTLITTMDGVAKITFLDEPDIIEIGAHVVANVVLSYSALYNLLELINHALALVKIEKVASDEKSEYVQSGEA